MNHLIKDLKDNQNNIETVSIILDNMLPETREVLIDIIKHCYEGTKDMPERRLIKIEYEPNTTRNPTV
jgi:hypothetical protein